jgi:hypothetical protein
MKAHNPCKHFTEGAKDFKVLGPGLEPAASCQPLATPEARTQKRDPRELVGTLLNF